MTKKDFFDKLNDHLNAHLPFVVYRKPGEQTVKALLQKNAAAYSSTEMKENGFLFSPFDLSKGNLLIPVDNSEVLELKDFEADDKRRGPAMGQGGNSENTNSEGKQRHLQLVEKAIIRIRESDLNKVVLSRRERVDFQDVNPLEMFKDLLSAYPDAFVYCWNHPESGIWLGASPEVLIKTEGLLFKTMALAGTQNFTGNPDVKWGEKEKLEQKFVTDAILENLNDLRLTEELNISETYTSRAGGVVHLRTDISGKMGSPENLETLINTLHPTPAVCGFPREKARDFIVKEEGYDREYYTGFLGELNFQEQVLRPGGNRRNIENLAYKTVRKRSALYVNLRCMKLERNQALIFVGGGITEDSVPENEFLETVNKAQTMRKVLRKYI